MRAQTTSTPLSWNRQRLLGTAACGLLLWLAQPTCILAEAQQISTPAVQTTPAAPPRLDSAVIYEIDTRTFSSPGNFQGIQHRLDTLQQLGVNVLWIMPISPTGVEHRLGRLGSLYSPLDYYAIDPAYGIKADFLALVQAAHQRHMRVILDMVADHTAWGSVLMRTHSGFYQHDASGHIVSPHGWTEVAALDYSNPALVQYMDSLFLYWLKTFDLDGFPCDAAGYVPTAFWNRLSPRLLAVRPDALLLAEASKPELMQTAFTLDYGWPLLATFDQVLELGAPATRVQQTIDGQAALFPSGTCHMLISDDHDERRATVRYGIEGALAASALVFTLPGVPMLYNGMEVGDATESASPEMFDKVDLDWSAAASFPGAPVYYHALIALRASSPALQHGSLSWVHNAGEQHVVSFLRIAPEETDLVTVNLSSTPFRGMVEIAADRDWQEAQLADSPLSEPRGRGACASPAGALARRLPSLHLSLVASNRPAGKPLMFPAGATCS